MKLFGFLKQSVIFAVALVLLALYGPAALAGSIAVSWTAPVKNTDGSNIPPTGADSLASYRVEYFQCATATSTWPATPASVTVAHPAAATTLAGLTSGSLYCIRVYAKNVGGVESVATVTGAGNASIARPEPPGALQVQAVVVSYVIQQNDKYVLLPAGEAAPGAMCDSTQSVLGRYVIPVSAVVKWYGNVRPKVVVGDCAPAA